MFKVMSLKSWNNEALKQGYMFSLTSCPIIHADLLRLEGYDFNRRLRPPNFQNRIT